MSLFCKIVVSLCGVNVPLEIMPTEYCFEMNRQMMFSTLLFGETQELTECEFKCIFISVICLHDQTHTELHGTSLSE